MLGAAEGRRQIPVRKAAYLSQARRFQGRWSLQCSAVGAAAASGRTFHVAYFLCKCPPTARDGGLGAADESGNGIADQPFSRSPVPSLPMAHCASLTSTHEWNSSVERYGGRGRAGGDTPWQAHGTRDGGWKLDPLRSSRS